MHVIWMRLSGMWIMIGRVLFFVDGPGGTEKIFLYKVLLVNVRSRGLIALATA